MAAVTDTIGTTARDFTTFTLHEASLGAHAGDTVTGECYNDSVFDELVVYNDATPTSLIVKPAAGEAHDGTAGTGVRIVLSSGVGTVLDVDAAFGLSGIIFEFLEIDCNGEDDIGIGSLSGQPFTVRNNLIHGGVSAFGEIMGIRTGDALRALDNTIYDMSTGSTGAEGAFGIDTTVAGSTTVDIMNNTIHKIVNDGGSGPCSGIKTTDNSNKTVQNNLVTDTGGTTSGSVEDYDLPAPATATYDHNLSSDTTASGTGSLTSKSASNIYVSTVVGSEDLRQKSGSPSIDAGVDKGTSPSGVEKDITGFNRETDTSRDPWDMGSHEFEAAATVDTPLIEEVDKRKEPFQKGPFKKRPFKGGSFK